MVQWETWHPQVQQILTIEGQRTEEGTKSKTGGNSNNSNKAQNKQKTQTQKHKHKTQNTNNKKKRKKNNNFAPNTAIDPSDIDRSLVLT